MLAAADLCGATPAQCLYLGDAERDIQAARAWQFDCIDEDGRVLMRGHDLVNLFFRVPRAYHEVRMDPLNGWLGAPLAPLPGTDIALWDVPMMAEDFSKVCTAS